MNRKLNAGSTKYYDTELLRAIHRNHWTNRFWQKMRFPKQERWGRRLGLRRPITQPVEWSPHMRQMLFEELGEEARQFLSFYGKPSDYWGFAAWANTPEELEEVAASVESRD